MNRMATRRGIETFLSLSYGCCMSFNLCCQDIHGCTCLHYAAKEGEGHSVSTDQGLRYFIFLERLMWDDVGDVPPKYCD